MAAKCVAVGSIGSYFESLPDPRDTRNRKHRFLDIVVIAVAIFVVVTGGPCPERSAAS